MEGEEQGQDKGQDGKVPGGGRGTKDKERLIHLIPEGKNHAITARELSAMMGIQPRAVTRCIQALRREGFAICATVDATQQQGYFFPSNEEEMVDYVRGFERRISSIGKTFIAARKWSFSELQKKRAEAREQIRRGRAEDEI